jgi:hydroxyacyl-ACP dehydratase HTD2-like protein with hotdog domain
MLLETIVYHKPEAMLKTFEYRATNPVIVNRPVTVNGAWENKKTAVLWCVDGNGVVGMTGKVQLE